MGLGLCPQFWGVSNDPDGAGGPTRGVLIRGVSARGACRGKPPPGGEERFPRTGTFTRRTRSGHGGAGHGADLRWGCMQTVPEAAWRQDGRCLEPRDLLTARESWHTHLRASSLPRLSSSPPFVPSSSFRSSALVCISFFTSNLSAQNHRPSVFMKTGGYGCADSHRAGRALRKHQPPDFLSYDS